MFRAQTLLSIIGRQKLPLSGIALHPLRNVGGGRGPRTASIAIPRLKTWLSSPGRPSSSSPAGKPSDVSPAGVLKAGARNAGAENELRRIAVSGYCRPLTSKVGGTASPSVGNNGAGIGMVG